MATQYIMYSASPDGSNMVSTPTAETIYRGIAYMPDSISTNPNLINSSTTYQNRVVNTWDWVSPQYNLNNMGIRPNDKITILSTVKIPSNAPKGIALNARFHASDTVYTDRPLNLADKGLILPGEEKENYTIATVPELVSTSGLPPVTVRIRYGRIDGNGTGDSFTTQGKCDGIFLGDTVKTWKPSPSDWLADKANYTWTNRGTTATRYSATIIGSGMTTDKQSSSKYTGLVTVPEDLYLHQNLLKDSAYYNNKAPFFKSVGTGTATTETVVLDGYSCTKVTLSETPSPGNKGVYLYNDSDRFYSLLQPYDTVVASFMIKGSIKWSPTSPAFERSTLLSLTNKKNSYPDWERVVWIGRRTELAGAFNFYSDDTQAHIFYLRDVCIQKAEEFTGYKIPPQEFVTNPYNFKWEPIEKTSIRYSMRPNGIDMTKEKLLNSKFVGISYISPDVYKNANLLLNTEYKNTQISGVPEYYTFGGLYFSVAGSQISLSQTEVSSTGRRQFTQRVDMNSEPITVSFSAEVYIPSSTQFKSGEFSNYYIRNYRVDGTFIDIGSIYLTSLERDKWIQINGSAMLSATTTYVNVSLAFGESTIGEVRVRKQKLEIGSTQTPWTLAIPDWFETPSSYTWVPIDERTIRYSPNANGSGLTVSRKWDSRYRGVGNIPLDLYSNRNILSGTARFTDWIISSPNLIENKGDYSTITFDRPIATQGEGYVDLLRKTNLSLKPDTYYTFSFYEEEASGDYSTYIFSDVAVEENVMTSEGRKNTFSDTRIVWNQRGTGIRKWVTFKTRSDINIGAYKNVLFRYHYSNPKVDFKLKVSRPMLVEGKDVTAWKQSPEDWANNPLNLTWYALPDVLQPEQNGNIEGMFPITNLKISNGIYYHLNVTKDTSLPYSREIPGWTYFTVLDCKFNNTLNAGNTNILLSQLEGLVIKRRKKGTFNWITLKEIKVNSPADLNIVYQDSFLPSGSEFQYALVPILNGNIEGEYVMNEVFSSFNGVFISDNETIFKLYNAVVYGGTTANTTKGMIQPIGRRYPIMVNNSEVNYKAGQISAQLLGYKFEKTRNIDRFDIVGQTDDLTDYLNTNTAKVITDWNGNIYVSRINNSPNISYNSAYGNGITTVSFDWVEQGKYDNQEEMYENGLVDTRG